MSAGTTVSHPGFPLSQPSSPIIDDNTHPQLVPSPCLGTPRSGTTTLLNRTISDESSNSSNRFLSLQSVNDGPKNFEKVALHKLRTIPAVIIISKSFSDGLIRRKPEWTKSCIDITVGKLASS
ncbi:hypothetical protein Y032_0323g2500 [Ancylostoma ceylanicum]|nr:hypothetical protein Y032_0323g2500 [Ancylostoma ceylanicum]